VLLYDSSDARINTLLGFPHVHILPISFLEEQFPQATKPDPIGQLEQSASPEKINSLMH
jgi:hypothetical protein